MKKTAIASVAFAAALFAVSCQKENNPAQNVSGPMTISAVSEGLNTPTKTEMIFKYDVAWSANDKIYVKDASGKYDTFTLQNGAGTTKGTFKQDGDVTFDGEVQAYYPATMLDGGSPVWPASQTNDQTIPMYCKKMLSGTTEERMDFSSLGSVLQIVFNTTQENVTLKSIEIKDGSATLSGAFTVDDSGKAVITATDKAGITLDLGTGKALGKGANYFNIAVPAGDYQDLNLVFTATDGAKCTMTKGKVNIACNTVGRLTLTGEKFKSAPPADALPEIFTVSKDGGITTKQIYFSKGNLWADGSIALHFENEQWKSTPSSDGSRDNNHVSHFTWSGTISGAVSPIYDGFNLFCCENNKQSVDGSGAIYYALSTKEWQYLFNSSSRMVKGKPCYSNAMSGVSIGGVTYKGVFIYPDYYNGDIVSSSMTWEQINEAGIVFLPAAGRRYDQYNIDNVGSRGQYLSSSPAGIEGVYLVYFDVNCVKPDDYESGNISYGYNIRLVTDCQ